MTEPRNKLTARDIMTPDVVTIEASSDLQGAMAIMDQQGFSQLPVMQAGKPIALLTETDVRRALARGQQGEPVSALASPLPKLATPETRLSGVLGLMQEEETLLIASAEDGALVGIITYWDMLVTGRPSLMVQEVELILRRVVAALCAEKYGPDWWPRLPANLRQRAEEEHKADGDADASPEHMLGHTSLWALIEIFRTLQPNLGDAAYARLHQIRQLRNKVAHLYVLTEEELADIARLCPAAGDWLISFFPPGRGLDN